MRWKPRSTPAVRSSPDEEVWPGDEGEICPKIPSRF